MTLKTPVVLTVFNRPDITEKVFAEIAKAQPLKLFIIADAPRANYPSDVEGCKAARAIIEKVDWDCEVLTDYSDVNLGPRKRISSGLDWVFNIVEEAIILEHDCLPHPSFFKFCEELLEKYRDDGRIALISGTNLSLHTRGMPYSYCFSRYPQIWGWATWRRFWKHYDVNITPWLELRDSGWLEGILSNKGPVYHYWKSVFDVLHEGKINTWDYQVTFTAWLQNALAITPRVNLVSNIGFGKAATHTKRKWHKFANMKRFEMTFPLSHPPDVSRNVAADRFVERYSLTPFRSLPIKIFLYASYKVKRWFLERWLDSEAVETNQSAGKP